MSLYFRLLDDLEKWLKEVETALASEDLGKDLTSVQVCYRLSSTARRVCGRLTTVVFVLGLGQNLIKKHAALEKDIRAHEPRVQKAFTTANDMIAANVRGPCVCHAVVMAMAHHLPP
jgi:hypothetical protein